MSGGGQDGPDQPPGPAATADAPKASSATPTGLVEGLWQGQVLYGWAADPQDLGVRPILRLMRGLEVLAEAEAAYQRQDGLPGFQLEAPWPVPPYMLLDGLIRVRAALPGRQASVTLAMSPAMLAELDPARPEAEVETVPSQPAEGPFRPEPPSTAQAAPDTALQPATTPDFPGAEAAPSDRDQAPEVDVPSLTSTDAEQPPAPAERKPTRQPVANHLITEQPVAPPPVAMQPATEQPQPGRTSLPFPLSACLALARQAAESRVPVFHLLVPCRSDVLAGVPGPGFAGLEAAAAAEPLLAEDWLPLRHGFARIAHPAALWRQDGRTLAVEGSLAMLDLLLSVLRLRHPQESARLAVAARLLARADLSSLPRRSITGSAEAEPTDTGLGLIGQVRPETEPALPAELFADLPTPRLLGGGLPGLETWSLPSAPLPWRVVVMTEPGLGGSSGPARLGWWLRHLVAECVISEALHIAAPEAVLAAEPDLLLTLSAGSADSTEPA